MKFEFDELIQHTAMKALCRNDIDDLGNGNCVAFYPKYLITIMKIKIYHKGRKMPAEKSNDLFSLHVIINICFKNLNHKNYLSSIFTDSFTILANSFLASFISVIEFRYTNLLCL